MSAVHIAGHGPVRRFLDVVADPQTYRNLVYLLVGLPLGTLWFTVLVTGLSLGLSLVVVALLGLPVLLLMWYVTRGAANVELRVVGLLPGGAIAPAPMAAPRGNVWVRLRSMTRERDRWRELAFLMLRLPAGIATFTAVAVALAVPVGVAAAPFTARFDESEPFGTWRYATEMDDVASSPLAWLLVPTGFVLLVAALHLLDALARASGRWARSWLGR
jgi:hypothetical protein